MIGIAIEIRGICGVEVWEEVGGKGAKTRIYSTNYEINFGHTN